MYQRGIALIPLLPIMRIREALVSYQWPVDRGVGRVIYQLSLGCLSLPTFVAYSGAWEPSLLSLTSETAAN